MKNTSSLMLFLAIITLFFAACEPEDATPITSYTNGVFIVNEGAAGANTAELSFYTRTSGGITENLFSQINTGSTIGEVLTSMTIYGNKAYLAVTNSNKIIVLDATTLKVTETISGFEQPRYVYAKNDSIIYVSQAGAGTSKGGVVVYNTASKSVVKTIATGIAPNRFAVYGIYMYVPNNGKANVGLDSTITVVDISADTIIKKINVGGINPSEISIDANSDLWVLCSGSTAPNNAGKLVKVRGFGIERSFEIPQFSQSLTADATGYNLYFVGNKKLYKKDIANFGTNAPATLSLSNTQNLYGVGIDPKSKNIYVSDAMSANEKSKIWVLDPTNLSVQDSFRAGIKANSFYFR